MASSSSPVILFTEEEVACSLENYKHLLSSRRILLQAANCSGSLNNTVHQANLTTQVQNFESSAIQYQQTVNNIVALQQFTKTIDQSLILDNLLRGNTNDAVGSSNQVSQIHLDKNQLNLIMNKYDENQGTREDYVDCLRGSFKNKMRISETVPALRKRFVKTEKDEENIQMLNEANKYLDKMEFMRNIIQRQLVCYSYKEVMADRTLKAIHKRTLKRKTLVDYHVTRPRVNLIDVTSAPVDVNPDNSTNSALYNSDPPLTKENSYDHGDENRSYRSNESGVSNVNVNTTVRSVRSHNNQTFRSEFLSGTRTTRNEVSGIARLYLDDTESEAAFSRSEFGDNKEQEENVDANYGSFEGFKSLVEEGSGEEEEGEEEEEEDNEEVEQEEDNEHIEEEYESEDEFEREERYVDDHLEERYVDDHLEERDVDDHLEERYVDDHLEESYESGEEAEENVSELLEENKEEEVDESLTTEEEDNESKSTEDIHSIEDSVLKGRHTEDTEREDVKSGRGRKRIDESEDTDEETNNRRFRKRIDECENESREDTDREIGNNRKSGRYRKRIEESEDKSREDTDRERGNNRKSGRDGKRIEESEYGEEYYEASESFVSENYTNDEESVEEQIDDKQEFEGGVESFNEQESYNERRKSVNANRRSHRNQTPEELDYDESQPSEQSMDETEESIEKAEEIEEDPKDLMDESGQVYTEAEYDENEELEENSLNNSNGSLDSCMTSVSQIPENVGPWYRSGPVTLPYPTLGYFPPPGGNFPQSLGYLPSFPPPPPISFYRNTILAPPLNVLYEDQENVSGMDVIEQHGEEQAFEEEYYEEERLYEEKKHAGKGRKKVLQQRQAELQEEYYEAEERRPVERNLKQRGRRQFLQQRHTEEEEMEEEYSYYEEERSQGKNQAGKKNVFRQREREVEDQDVGEEYEEVEERPQNRKGGKKKALPQRKTKVKEYYEKERRPQDGKQTGRRKELQQRKRGSEEDIEKESFVEVKEKRPKDRKREGKKAPPQRAREVEREETEEENEKVEETPKRKKGGGKKVFRQRQEEEAMEVDEPGPSSKVERESIRKPEARGQRKGVQSEAKGNRRR